MMEARPFGMHLLAAWAGIRKTPSALPLETKQIQGLDYF
jgi:hypothetical protein